MMDATHGNVAAAVVVEIVYVLALIGLVAVGLVWFSRWQRERRRRAEQAAAHDQQRRDLLLVRSGMAAVDQMSGVEFEEYVAAKLRQCGWQVSYTPVTGDYGVDLIAKRDGRCVAV